MGDRARLLFLGAGLVFLVATAIRALGDGSVTLPTWPGLLAAAAISAAGVLAAADGWLALARGSARLPALRAGFLAAQLGKYMPGGVWVGLGHVGFAMGAGLTGRQAAGALITYGLCLLAAAGALAGAGAGAGMLHGGPSWVGFLAVPLPLLLVRPWLQCVARRVGRASRRPDVIPRVPPQRALLRCFVRLVAALACSALAYGLLLRGSGVDITLASACRGFAIAWLAGFLAFGVPAGIGAREAALVLLLDAGAGAVVAASLAHRLVQGGAEVLLLLAVRRHIPVVARPAPSPRSVPSSRRSA